LRPAPSRAARGASRLFPFEPGEGSSGLQQDSSELRVLRILVFNYEILLYPSRGHCYLSANLIHAASPLTTI